MILKSRGWLGIPALSLYLRGLQCFRLSIRRDPGYDTLNRVCDDCYHEDLRVALRWTEGDPEKLGAATPSLASTELDPGSPQVGIIQSCSTEGQAFQTLTVVVLFLGFHLLSEAVWWPPHVPREEAEPEVQGSSGRCPGEAVL